MPTRSSLVLPPTKLRPCTKRVTIHNAKPVSAARTKNGPMRLDPAIRSAGKVSKSARVSSDRVTGFVRRLSRIHAGAVSDIGNGY
ncbi:hypothetical protein MINTM015_25360 [Mycobacterium paraintracellulare]|nr:hypothetical protein MINTM015_25360 [Mycobacterium paraintracellulare]